MINYSHQTIDNSDLKAVTKAIKSNFLSQGSMINNFENKLKIYFKAKNAAAVSSGTAALYLTALAMNWKKNDLIVTTPNTFLASANSILHSGATPLFVDISMDDYNIDLNKLEYTLRRYNSRERRLKP